MNSLITLTNVTKIFDEGTTERLIALSRVTLDIPQGELLAILGPSGSGKSTLLRILAGLEKSFEGTRALGKGVSPDDFSFVFQQFALMPWMTVAENAALGLVARGVSPREQQKIVSRELQRFGLFKYAHLHPRELSGGMRQRVGFARALATDPKVIFMDEPFSELDSFTAEELRQEFMRIWREKKLTVVIVTHLIEEALELADRIVVLTSRPGKIEKVIINNLERPRNKRADAFFNLEDRLYGLIKP